MKVTFDRKPKTISKSKETEEWIEKMKWLSHNFSKDDLDMKDERTQYIMR